MRIYIDIQTAQENAELGTFVSQHNIIALTEITMLGIYCLDNSEKTVYYPCEQEVTEVPLSFRLSWDFKHIENLYLNKIIGRFNEGKLKWTLMDAEAMAPMIQVLMYGMKKYDRDNWKKACPKRLDLMDSLQRHSLKIIAGESIDPESGLPHIGHLMCNAMFYSYWEQKTDGLFENFETDIEPF